MSFFEEAPRLAAALALRAPWPVATVAAPTASSFGRNSSTVILAQNTTYEQSSSATHEWKASAGIEEDAGEDPTGAGAPRRLSPAAFKLSGKKTSSGSSTAAVATAAAALEAGTAGALCAWTISGSLCPTAASSAEPASAAWTEMKLGSFFLAASAAASDAAERPRWSTEGSSTRATRFHRRVFLLLPLPATTSSTS